MCKSRAGSRVSVLQVVREMHISPSAATSLLDCGTDCSDQTNHPLSSQQSRTPVNILVAQWGHMGSLEHCSLCCADSVHQRNKEKLIPPLLLCPAIFLTFSSFAF